MRAPPSARISPRTSQGSSFGLLILLDEALPAGCLEACAQLACLAGASKGPNHGTVIGAFGAQVRLMDRGLPTAQLVRELGLQAAERRLGLTLAALRGNLDIAARPAARCRRGRLWRYRGRPGRHCGGLRRSCGGLRRRSSRRCRIRIERQRPAVRCGRRLTRRWSGPRRALFRVGCRLRRRTWRSGGGARRGSRSRSGSRRRCRS